MRKRIPVLLLVVLLVALAVPAPHRISSIAQSVSAAPAEPIRVGLNLPLSGPVGFLGQDERDGYELALEEINRKGGVLGRPLRLFYADNQCSPTEGVNAHRKLLDLDKVVVTIGGACSSATLAFMPLVEQARVPNLVQSATNPEITRRAGVGGNVWIFRLNVDDSIMAQTFSKVLAEKAKTVVMIAANNDWGRGAVAAYRPHFEELKVNFLGAEYFEQGQPDFRPILTKVKGQNPQALLLIMESRDAATMIRQMKEMGWTPRPLLFARGSVVTPEFAKAIKDDCSLGDGIVEATLNANGIYPEFDRAFEKKYGHEPHLSSGLAYAALNAVARAIQAGGAATPHAIRIGFTKLNYVDPIMGPVKFDKYNQNHPNMVITTMRECKVQLLQVVPTQAK